MHTKIRALILISVFLSLLFSVHLAGASPAQANRGAWAPNVGYAINDTVTYNGSTYYCIQAHTSLNGWEPPNVPALWGLASGPTATSGAVTTTRTRTATPAGPLNTSTRTPTRTNTSIGPSHTSTRTPTRTNSPTMTPVGPAYTATRAPTRTSTPGTGTSCAAAWNATTTYLNGNVASDNGHNYKANWWNQNERPSTSTTGVWSNQGTCAPPTAGPTSQPGSGLPNVLSAVYADISFTSVQASYQANGQKYYALAFVLGNGGACVPAWDGTHPMSENYYASQINAIRAAGGDVIAVFGGANGSDIASVCTTVSSLQAAYQAVINRYQFKWLDLNIEGGLISDGASLDRRNKAIAALQAANPNLKISYTLPVMQTGLLQTALDLLSNAKANGVRIDYVNVMAMNYGPAGVDMGQAAINAATNTHNQLVGLGIPAKLGVTPMIGQNNTAGEIFDLADADQLIAFAKANSYIGWLSFWSLGRDNGGCAGSTTASASCSGIAQNNYAFTIKFKAFP
jgi:chitodextrinase